MVAAAAMTRNPEPISIKPSANFAGAEGFKLRLAKHDPQPCKKGRKIKMKMEFAD